VKLEIYETKMTNLLMEVSSGLMQILSWQEGIKKNPHLMVKTNLRSSACNPFLGI
jgi:hypothetical protein